ncbi:MAG TPA: hypothetical protein VK014_13300 [Cyclobacteriaceae bacterium]|nr:hypothetical protein [Cyclobacteriaceae bacterium]
MAEKDNLEIQSLAEQPRQHLLWMPDRRAGKYLLLLLLILVICTFVLDPPLLDQPFPPAVVKVAKHVIIADLILINVVMVYFAMYRKKKSITLDENGIHLQDKKTVVWNDLQWYHIHVFSSRGLRVITLNTKDQKLLITAEDDKALGNFEKDLRHFAPIHSPSAKDYKQIPSSKRWGYFYIGLVLALYFGAVFYFELKLVFTLLLAPEVLFVIMMIYVEKIRGRPWSLAN